LTGNCFLIGNHPKEEMVSYFSCITENFKVCSSHEHTMIRPCAFKQSAGEYKALWSIEITKLLLIGLILPILTFVVPLWVKTTVIF